MQRTAELLIAEIGTDMNQFPTAGHLASWAGQCPGNDQSAGKRRSGRTRKGSKHLNAVLKDAAMAATRTNGSYLQSLYRRKKSQLGHARALGAVKHSMICASWHMLATGELYTGLGGDYHARRDPERQPNASSPSSNASATLSRCSRPDRARAYFPLETISGSVWSFWLGLVVTLVGLIAFGGFAKGKWY